MEACGNDPVIFSLNIPYSGHVDTHHYRPCDTSSHTRGAGVTGQEVDKTSSTNSRMHEQEEAGYVDDWSLCEVV